MNRYFVRSLVAILTFCIGLALSSVFSFIPRRSKFRHWESSNCRKAFQFERQYESRLGSLPSPALSIDNVGTDPLKLVYASTRSNHNSFPRQTVELLVGNNSKRTVESFTVSYRSVWTRYRHGGGSVVVNRDAKVSTFPSRNPELVAIDCDADETLTVWVSSVEFTDGTRWNNPRHPDN